MIGYYFRIALINLRRTPLLSLLVVLIMGLGIAVPATFESIRQAWAHNPMAHKDNKLYVVQLESQQADESIDSPNHLPLRLTYPDAMALRASDVPARKASMMSTGFLVRPERAGLNPNFIRAWATDGDFFSLFDVPFVYGNAWDSTIDREAAPVAVISESLNQWLFGGGNNVGKTVQLNFADYRVVGITENWNPTPRFYDIDGDLRGVNELFVPFSLVSVNQLRLTGSTSGRAPNAGYQEMLQSDTRWVQHWVALDNAAQKADYAAYLERYIAQQKLIGRFPRENAGYDLKTTSEWLGYRGVVDDRIQIVSLIGFLFLALCLINGICILWAKFLRYRTMIGIRRALGAKRDEIYLQLMMEAMTLGMLGGLLGFAISALGLWRIGEKNQRLSILTEVDAGMIGITLGIALASALLMGLYPAYRACQMSPSISIKGP